MKIVLFNTSAEVDYSPHVTFFAHAKRVLVSNRIFYSTSADKSYETSVFEVRVLQMNISLNSTSIESYPLSIVSQILQLIHYKSFFKLIHCKKNHIYGFHMYISKIKQFRKYIFLHE